jgi:hypothetical protein
MHDANYFRGRARRCRALSKTAMEPEAIEQLRVWAADFTEEADDAERRAAAEREEAGAGADDRS